MAIRDVAGRLNVGIFEKVELPDGRIATPLRGRGHKIDYEIEGKTVRSTSRYSPEQIAYDAMMSDADDALMLFPMRTPKWTKGKKR